MRSYGSTRVRLVWIVALSLAIFVADINVPLGAGMAVAYISVILSSLWSMRERKTWIAACLVSALTVLRLFVDLESSLQWIALSDRALALFAIWTVAILGLWQKRTTRAQSLAQVEAAQAQKNNAALKAALVRTEAAEAQLRRGQKLIDTVAEMARIGGWEIDLPTMRPIWTQEVYRIHEVDPSTPIDLQAAIEFYAPDARPVMEKAVRAAIERGTSFDLTVPLITAAGRRRWVRCIGVAERTNGVTTRLSGAFQDITEQHEIQMRLARASRSSSEGHWDYDFGTETVWCSSTFQELLGHPAQDVRIPADDFHRNAHPDDQLVISVAFEQHITDGTPYEVQYRMQTASGEWRWFEARGAVERDDLGRLVSFAGSLIDIHEDRLAQEELRAVRLRFDRAIHGTQDGLWDWDLIAQRMWVSPRYCELLGYDEGTLPAHPHELSALVVYPDDLPNLAAMANAAIEGHAPFDIELRMITRSQEIRWFRIRGSIERDVAGKALSLSGSIQDNTPRKLAESARIEAEQRLERAIRGSSDGFFEHQIASDRSWYSPRVREMLGYGPDDAFPHSIRELMDAEDRARDEAAVRAHYERNEPYDLTFRLRTRSGAQRWFRGRGRCELDEQGKPTRFSGSIQDITTQREAEQALVAAKEASAAANRAKSDFLANMSHEIRTPMNGVLGMTELLLDTPLEPVQREFGETIRTSATSLLGILNDILDFSKIEAGKLDIERVEMDIRECVEDVGSIMAVQAAAKNIEFIVNVDPSIPDRVFGDPHRLRQIMTNLIGNAIKFTTQGEVVIEVLTVAVQSGRALLNFEVRDSGMGMSQEVLSRLFQPFVQADASTTRHYGGTGLGLSIVRRLVELMGGKVSVVSSPGKGSTFSFTLPCDIADSFTGTSTSVVFNPRGKRVLVVDDNHTNRRVLCGQLCPAGYEVETAASADEAIALLQKAAAAGKRFDVVVADDQMPGCDGSALGARIKLIGPVAETPLVMLTSLDRHGNVQRLSDLGFAGYLTKPVRGRELRACIARVMEMDTVTGATGSFPRIVTRGSLGTDKGHGRYHGRVLVVEDNPVNQQVTRRFLERLGCEVTVAENGKRAVEFCSQGKFALVLMDVQMPVMDGLAATREIRRHESPGQRTPIIALTASAMTDELERCLEAGMDSLLTKPLEPLRLRETLDRHGLGSTQPAAVASAPAAAARVTPAIQPIDLVQLRIIVGDDREFMQELCRTFIASSSKILEELRRAIESQDRALLGAMAHKLKGGSGSVCARRIGDLAASLEKSAPSGDMPQLGSSVEQIHVALEECAGFIEAQVA
jgi:two-component system, sensor histidine kinase and response regulator